MQPPVDDASCIVFLHVPKTAGSTLTTVLRWQYRRLRPHQVLRVSPHESIEEQLDRLGPAIADLRVLMGHFPYGAHELLPMPCRYITIVRDPVNRVLSEYRYVLSASGHPLHDALTSSSMDVDEYLSSGIDRFQLENALTRQLSGRDEHDDTPPTEHDVEVASDHLRTFDAVGLTERFDESLVLFKQVLGWSTPLYFRRNVSKAGPASGQVPADVIARIRERNLLDLRIYELAGALFRTRTAAGGDPFVRQLRRFRRLNRVPAALGPILEPIAPVVRRGLERRAARRAP
jgi:hypothetical protein